MAVPTSLLPRRAYSDNEWFERELALLGRSWSLVAGLDELDTPGDDVTAHVGAHHLRIERGADGELRAWCDEASPASVGVWEGMVFAHPDAGAPPLPDALGELPDRIGSFRPGRLVQVGRLDLEARCNWKLFVENHVDVYHLWYLHAATLGDFDHARFEYLQLDRNWVSWEPLLSGTPMDAAVGAGGVEIAGLADRDRLGIGAHFVFPNLMMATTAEFFATYQAVPLAPDRTRIELRIRAERHADGDALVAAARSFIAEDIVACERIQDAVGADRFIVGPLCRTHEAPVLTFQSHVLDAVAPITPGETDAGDPRLEPTWQAVATTNQLTEPGDYVATMLGSSPVVIVHGADGELRGFLNMCRHRGMTLVAADACGNAPRGLVCPYHAWNFGLDGSLRSVPQRADQFPDVDLAEWGLLPVPIAVHADRVYAHPDPAAEGTFAG